jgi:hypothetical protein
MGDGCVRSGGALVQIGRQGDAGGMEDAADLADDGGSGRDALPSFSVVAARSRSRVAQQVAPSDKSGRGELIKTV